MKLRNIRTRSSARATAVRSPPPPLYLVSASEQNEYECGPYGLWSPSVGGGVPPQKCDQRCGTNYLSEPQNGHPAITAGSSDHKWTLHNDASHQSCGRTWTVCKVRRGPEKAASHQMYPHHPLSDSGAENLNQEQRRKRGLNNKINGHFQFGKTKSQTNY